VIHITGLTGRLAYRDVLRQVLRHGRERSARGLKTIDAGMTVITLKHAYDALPLGVRPNLSTRVAAAEAIQLIGAFHDPGLMLAASSKFGEFVEPDGKFHGAYGARIGRQVHEVIKKLVADPDTRQAVITLWDYVKDNEPGKKDYPCTIGLRFELEDAKVLNLDVLMRSNDAWLGLPYDFFQFTQLQLTVANALKVRPGRYRHTAWSLHLYADDVAAAERLATEHVIDPDQAPQSLPIGIDCHGVDPVVRYHDAARRAMKLTLPSGLVDMTSGEEWYRARLRPDIAS